MLHESILCIDQNFAVYSVKEHAMYYIITHGTTSWIIPQHLRISILQSVGTHLVTKCL